MTRTTLFVVAVAAIALVVAYRMLTGGATEPTSDVVAAIERGASVVDVRTPGEFAGGHVAGALHANVFDGDFEQRVDRLDRSEPVYLYCASGARSGRAAAVLEGMGFERVVNAGGFDDLAAAGAPVER
ncbi:rhodanese-like domain-containing protein [Rubrivirga sp.]|uniref:rhodanese-like domain-containing protein n=1 Tax=Rubrivirga sp. TaxID=1885344 RepID=UPI003B515931